MYSVQGQRQKSGHDCHWPDSISRFGRDTREEMNDVVDRSGSGCGGYNPNPNTLLITSRIVLSEESGLAREL